MKPYDFLHGRKGHEWKKEYGTRLKGFLDKNESQLQLPLHGDWDCVSDFEWAELLENKGTGMNSVFVLAPLGQALAAELRRHKQNGGNFADFDPTVVQSKLKNLNIKLSMKKLIVIISLISTCACMQAQNLFVSDDGSGNIYEFTPSGAQSIFASELQSYWTGL